MNCLINDVISESLKKGKKTEVVRRFLKIKYRTNIDPQSLERRMQGLKGDVKFA